MSVFVLPRSRREAISVPPPQQMDPARFGGLFLGRRLGVLTAPRIHAAKPMTTPIEDANIDLCALHTASRPLR